jgi:hypothetical protein
MIKAALDQYAAASNKSWLLERSATVGASAVGACARKTWFEKNADDPDSPRPDPDYVDSYGAKIRGTVIEASFWAPALMHAYGNDLLYADNDQRTLVLDLLSATPDGLLINQPRDALKHLGIEDIESDCIALECKSISERVDVSNLPKPENVFQANTQLGMFRALTEHKPMYAVVSYINAGWWDVCHEYVVKFDPAVFETAKLRARDIMLAQSAQALKPEGFIAGGKDCDYCAFTRACGSARSAYVPREEKPIGITDTVRIANQAKNAKALKAQAEQFAADARAAEALLRDMLAEVGTRRVEGEGVKVRWSQTKPRAGFDNAALKEAAIAAGIDITQFQKQGAPGDQLVISEVGQ